MQPKPSSLRASPADLEDDSPAPLDGSATGNPGASTFELMLACSIAAGDYPYSTPEIFNVGVPQYGQGE